MDYSGKIIRDILVIRRNKEDFEKYSKIGGKDPLYDCKCLLCGRLFVRGIRNIKHNKFGNCGCKSLQYDLTNQRFTHLIALKPLGVNKHKEMLWECRCDCGNITEATSYALRNGIKNQCEKCQYKIIGGKNRKYIKHSARLFHCYVNLKTRATNIKQDKFDRYINRGITICEEWKKSFENFQKWALENGYKENLTIDRIDNNKGYFPENCRWVDRTTQANNRRTNVILTYNGVNKTMAEWSRELNIPYYYLQKYHKKFSLGEIIKNYGNLTRYKGKNK